MIKSWSRVVAVLFLVLALVVAALMAAAWSVLPLDRTALTLNGETFSLADLQGWHVVLFFVMAVVLVLLALVAAMAAVVVGLGFGALGIAIGLLATIGSLALVAAPFALIVWLLWRLFRSRPAPVVVASP